MTVVGISTYNHVVSHGHWEDPSAFVPVSYSEALAAAGAQSVLLPSTLGAREDAVEGVLGRLDGLVLTGGYDVCGRLYGRTESEDEHEAERHDPRRDEFEAAASRVAWKLNIPTLAICRGLQILNVALGGTLIADLESAGSSAEHRATPGDFSPHRVTLDAGTLAREILGDETVVPSHHHQAISELAPGLRVSGRADDGVIEAAESSDSGRFALGVQWHPEAGSDHALFRALVDACAPSPVTVR